MTNSWFDVHLFMDSRSTFTSVALLLLYRAINKFCDRIRQIVGASGCQMKPLFSLFSYPRLLIWRPIQFPRALYQPIAFGMTLEGLFEATGTWITCSEVWCTRVLGPRIKWWVLVCSVYTGEPQFMTAEPYAVDFRDIAATTHEGNVASTDVSNYEQIRRYIVALRLSRWKLLWRRRTAHGIEHSWYRESEIDEWLDEWAVMCSRT
jgi:hypothetical protein